MLEATTGEDGVRLAREHFPQLVLMDIQLPGISGIEALRELQGDPRTSQIPIMAVTASVMQNDRNRSWKPGLMHMWESRST